MRSMRYQGFSRTQKGDEMKKEALRLISELAEDELKLEKACDSAREFKCQGNIDDANDLADEIICRIDRKTRLLDMILHTNDY